MLLCKKTFKITEKNEIKLCHDSQIDVKTVHTNKLKSNNKIAISLNNKLTSIFISISI